MDVQFRRRPVDVVNVEPVADATRQVIQQAHPTQSDNSASILCHICFPPARSGALRWID